jgi:transcriptional regulator with XRE-family HTH domain
MRADRLLIENIQHLLSKRGHKQKELADWCGHSETWISSIFRGERQFRITDYDKIADFFGIAVYQLFQPGIAPITERRKPHSDRRSGEDRRVSKAHRAMLELRDEIDAARPRRPKPAEAED